MEGKGGNCPGLVKIGDMGRVFRVPTLVAFVPGTARVERLCRCTSGRQQAEPATQGVPGQSPGTRVAGALADSYGSLGVLSAKNFKQLTAGPTCGEPDSEEGGAPHGSGSSHLVGRGTREEATG